MKGLILVFGMGSALALAGILAGGQEPAASAPAKPGSEVRLYVPGIQLQRGQSTSVVIEMRNNGLPGLEVPNQVGLERVVRRHQDDKMAPQLEQRLPRRGWALSIRTHVPPGSQERFVAPSRRHSNVETRAVPFGDYLLLKVEVPAEALEAGECLLEGVLWNGDQVMSTSPAIAINVIDAPRRP